MLTLQLTIAASRSLVPQADTITAGDGNDVIIAGGSPDQVVSLGAETIDVGTGTDTVEFTKIAVAGSVGGAAVVTGMAAGTGADVNRALDSSYAFFNGTSDGVVKAATGADMDALHGVDANFTFGTISTNVATHTSVTYLAGTSTITQLEGTIATALGTATDAKFANTDKVLIGVDDGTNTMLVYVESAGNNNAIAAAELSVVGILKGITDATTLVAGNVAFA